MPRITAEELTADRLTLEPLRVDHADEMVDVLADESIYAFIGGAPPSLEALRARYEVQSRGGSRDGSQVWMNWIIRLSDTGRAAGYVQATVTDDDDGRCVAEIAWVIGPAFQGRRIATTATVAMCAFLRERGVDELVAHVHPDHPASQGVAGAAGLHPTSEVVDGEVRWVAAIRGGGGRPGAGRGPGGPTP